MIWHDGAVLPDKALRVGIDDRVFEHGLGLFETFRSWDGRAPLLGRHLARLRASARALGIPLDRVRLPDAGAVAELLSVSGFEAEAGLSRGNPHPSPPPQGGRGPDGERGSLDAPDALLRLTLTAGSETSRPVAWMTARPLPGPESIPLRVVSQTGYVEPFVHAHKMLNYWGRRMAFEAARAQGADEALLTSPEGIVWEGARNSLLIVPRGRTMGIVCPSLNGPVLPGIMRRVATEYLSSRGYAIDERTVCLGELFEAEAVYLANSVRGVRTVGRIDGRALKPPDEGMTRRLVDELPDHIRTLTDADEPAP